MTTMTPAAATELLTDVLASRRQGGTWRQLAMIHGYDSPQAMKHAAREAAKIAQAFLLEQKAAGGVA
jgi:hypothetical protein